MRTCPSLRARTVAGTYRSLRRESLGEEYLLTSSCSFIASKLSYRVSVNGSKELESEVFKTVSGEQLRMSTLWLNHQPQLIKLRQMLS